MIARMVTITSGLVLALVPAPGSADFLPEGPDFLVNTYTSTYQRGRQARAIGRADDCSFVVVWESGTYPQDGSWYGVFGRRFDAAGGPLGTEFQINTYTTQAQYRPAVAQNGPGAFVVVWESVDYLYGNYQDGASHGIFGQRFDTGGNPAGTEFPVNTTTSGSERQPSVDMADDGSFVVVWRGLAFVSSGNPGERIFGQRFDPTGAPSGTEFVVLTCTTTVGCEEYNRNPDVAVLDQGRFVVVWEEANGFDGDHEGIFGQRFDAAGLPEGTQFVVNTYTEDPQRHPAVEASDTNGSFVVAWDSYTYGNLYPYSGANVRAQMFDANGNPVGTELQVNSYVREYSLRPAVAVDDDGAFVVVWDNSYYHDGEGYGVFGQRFAATGLPVGTEFQVNTYTSSEQWLANSVASDGNGNFVVAWASGEEFGPGQDGSTFGMAARSFCRDAAGTGTCDACGADVPVFPVDHFLCRASKRKRKEKVTLADLFDAGTYGLKTGKFFCSPADKNGEGTQDLETHLTMYKANGPHAQRTGVGVANQFGAFTLDTKKTSYLLVPTSRSQLGLPAPAPPDSTIEVDHYRCLRAKYAPTSLQLSLAYTVDVTDEIEATTLTKLKPYVLCVATDKNNEGIKSPDAHLMCYKAKPSTKSIPYQLQVQDQFDGATVRVTKKKLLCVPSSVSL